MAAMMDLERTYIMIKPDGVQRGLIGDIVKRFEQKGFKLVAAKLYSPSRAHFEKHYEDLKGKKFFPSMIDYMITGPVFCMVWAGKGAVKTGRKMLGETNPGRLARVDPRRLLHRHRAQHLPRLGHGRERREGDRALVPGGHERRGRRTRRAGSTRSAPAVLLPA